MNWRTLDSAIVEAQRFLDRAIELRSKGVMDKNYPDRYMGNSYGKQSGAVRRASMDLTRVLAKLRKGE